MEEYTCKHFSISLPQGENQADVADLLRHLADSIDDLSVSDVLDITFKQGVDHNGNDSPSLTVYYQ